MRVQILFSLLPCLLTLVHFVSAEAPPSLYVYILSQPHKRHVAIAEALQKSIEKQNEHQECKLRFFASNVGEFAETWGDHTVWVALTRLYEAGESESPDWLLVLDEATELRLPKLLHFLKEAKAGQYYAHGLSDKEPSITHHYHMDRSFQYPDTGGGILLSWELVKSLVERMKADKPTRDFTIDPKHELAMLLWNEDKGVRLTADNNRFCTLQDSEECITFYRAPEPCGDLSADKVFFGVKTFSGNHKDRVVVVKRTWAHDTRHIEFYSDAVDEFVPTIDLDVPNTERGHCEKTIRIIQRFHETRKANTDLEWLVVADDDTLLSVPRLLSLLSCYDPKEPVILGERYGYGYSVDGQMGYDYPTGGPSMIFSHAAVASLVGDCKCPSISSPDDMVLGMCARRTGIPILHSEAFHQARPEDYSADYLHRIPPISFHKHWMTDPYKIYVDRLQVGEAESSKPLTDTKTEL